MTLVQQTSKRPVRKVRKAAQGGSALAFVAALIEAIVNGGVDTSTWQTLGLSLGAVIVTTVIAYYSKSSLDE